MSSSNNSQDLSLVPISASERKRIILTSITDGFRTAPLLSTPYAWIFKQHPSIPFSHHLFVCTGKTGVVLIPLLALLGFQATKPKYDYTELRDVSDNVMRRIQGENMRIKYRNTYISLMLGAIWAGWTGKGRLGLYWRILGGACWGSVIGRVGTGQWQYWQAKPKPESYGPGRHG